MQAHTLRGEGWMADLVGQFYRVVPAEVAQVYNFYCANQGDAAGRSRCADSVGCGSKHTFEGMCRGCVGIRSYMGKWPQSLGSHIG